MAEVTLKSQEQIQRQLQKQKGQFYQCDITLTRLQGGLPFTTSH